MGRGLTGQATPPPFCTVVGAERATTPHTRGQRAGQARGDSLGGGDVTLVLEAEDRAAGGQLPQSSVHRLPPQPPDQASRGAAVPPNQVFQEADGPGRAGGAPGNSPRYKFTAPSQTLAGPTLLACPAPCSSA